MLTVYLVLNSDLFVLESMRSVIVGSVDGNRIWGKDLDLPLAKVEWSPDSCHVLFTTTSGKCVVYSADGEYVRDLALSSALPGTAAPASLSNTTKKLGKTINNTDFESDPSSSTHSVVALECYKGVPDAEASPAADGVPSLAVAMSSGWVQLMMHALDENMIVFDCGLKIKQVILECFFSFPFLLLLVLSSSASDFVDETLCPSSGRKLDLERKKEKDRNGRVPALQLECY